MHSTTTDKVTFYLATHVCPQAFHVQNLSEEVAKKACQ